MMWYGVLGTKELLQRTYKNLEQKVQLEVRQKQSKRVYVKASSLRWTYAPGSVWEEPVSSQARETPGLSLQEGNEREDVD